jgi:hypothetical protein
VADEDPLRVLALADELRAGNAGGGGGDHDVWAGFGVDFREELQFQFGFFGRVLSGG